jgi:hypothetical protein
VRAAATATVLLIAAGLGGCASDPHGRETDRQRVREAQLVQKCSGASVEMRKSIIEAIVRGGVIGVHTAAWLCGQTPGKVWVRIVYLHYTHGNDPPDEFVPVMFEDGRMVAFGWQLLEQQPDRYGVRLPARGEPLFQPAHWVLVQ